MLTLATAIHHGRQRAADEQCSVTVFRCPGLPYRPVQALHIVCSDQDFHPFRCLGVARIAPCGRVRLTD